LSNTLPAPAHAAAFPVSPAVPAQAYPFAQVIAAHGAAFPHWFDQLKRTGGCARPIRLVGESMTLNKATGEVIASYSTEQEPTGCLMTACGNRRAGRCPSCSYLYKGDAFHLIRAGLTGDTAKGVSEQVRSRPRVFATFTAPSFGPVHARVEHNGQVQPCRARRDAGTCRHANPQWCTERHQPDDERIGQPLCPYCFDYAGAVLWNAHAGTLWRRLVTYLPRQLARLVGLTHAEFTAAARISYGKVAEYQHRGLVHFHAVIRFDGPEADADPPAWATTELLEAGIRAATAAVTVTVPATDGEAARACGWGEQLDIRPIRTGDLDNGEDLGEGAVAGYIAKYATKAAEDAGTVDYPLTCKRCAGVGQEPIYDYDEDRRRRIVGYHDMACRSCRGNGLAYEIAALPVTRHAQTMIVTAWTLGGLPGYAHLKLRKWAHMLGFRGHFLTKARRYSTTFGALRAARTRHATVEARTQRDLLPDQRPQTPEDLNHQDQDQADAETPAGLVTEDHPEPFTHRDPDPEEDTTLVIRAFRYIGAGLTPTEALFADQIRRDAQDTRDLARQAREAVPA
jgi:hypothetical protein